MDMRGSVLAVWWLGVALASGAAAAAPSRVVAPLKPLVQAPGPTPHPASPSELSTQQAEQELAAIRRALIEQALEGPTRVRAWAWVDDQGALRERNEVTSDMRVRGVRVAAYRSTDDGKLEPSIQAVAARSETGQCNYTQGHWRLPMSVELDVSAVNYAPLQPIAQAAVEAAQASWSQTLASKQRYRVSALRVRELTPYQRALWGAVDSEVGWRAKWEVAVSNLPDADQTKFQAPWSARQAVASPDPLLSQVSFRLTITRETRRPSEPASQVVWVGQHNVVVSMQATGWTAPQLGEDSRAAIAQLGAQWAQALDQLTACEPLQYDLTELSDHAMRINAGANAGLQVGDRVVVMDAASVPTQVWDQGSLERVAIARVERVDAYGAQLLAVAGRRPQGSGRWVALPY